MPSESQRRGLFVTRGPTGEKYAVGTGPAPDYAPADIAYLDHQAAPTCQLRPLLRGERTPGSVGQYPPGTQMLVCRTATGSELRALVKLPFEYRKNTQANVERAIERVSQFNPSLGELFRRAKSGEDPLPLGETTE